MDSCADKQTERELGVAWEDAHNTLLSEEEDGSVERPLRHSGPQFPHLENGGNSATYVKGLVRGLRRMQTRPEWGAWNVVHMNYNYFCKEN